MWGHPDVRNLGLGCVGCATIISAAVVVVAATLSSWLEVGGTWLLALGGAVLLGRMADSMRRAECRVVRYQIGRSKRALRIARTTMAGHNPSEPYFLYLRPFAIDGAIVDAPRNVYTREVVERFGIPTAKHDLESALALLVHGHGELLALSNELGSAAGKVKTTDDRWKEEVAALCEHAEGLFVVPFDFEGTAWEVSRIQANRAWLEKTMFIMPVRPPGAWLTRPPDYRDMWERGRLKYGGLELPEYDERGGVVVFRERASTFIPGFGNTRAFRDARRVRDGLARLRGLVADLAAANAREDAAEH